MWAVFSLNLPLVILNHPKQQACEKRLAVHKEGQLIYLGFYFIYLIFLFFYFFIIYLFIVFIVFLPLLCVWVVLLLNNPQFLKCTRVTVQCLGRHQSKLNTSTGVCLGRTMHKIKADNFLTIRGNLNSRVRKKKENGWFIALM